MNFIRAVRRLLLHPFWLFFALPGYVAWRLLSALSIGPAGVAAGITVLLAFCLFIPFSMRARTMLNRKLADRVSWVGSTAMGFFSSLFVLTLLRDLVLAGARLFMSGENARLWTTPSAQLTLVLAFLMTLTGFISARRRPGIVEVRIPVLGLPQALHGFSIAQISDVHVGPTITRGFVERIVRRVNALNADMIAVTGDLVDGSVQQLSAHTAPLAGLTARHGTYFVTGNHEYYSGERAWTDEIRRLGMRVLKNEHVVLEHDGTSLVLAGVTDYSAHHFDPAQRSDPAAALRSKNTTCTSTKLGKRCRSGGFRCTNLGAHTWRTILALEPIRTFVPALHQRPASIEKLVDLRKPRHRLLGTAESFRRSF
jgi:predicted MPP superfamily phosphohydrolase